MTTINQGYRAELRAAILQEYPGANVICPLRILTDRFASRRAEVFSAYQVETTRPVIERRRYSSEMTELTATFVELVTMASSADVLVAWLPDHEASMGTAMEIWSAASQGKIVVCISSMMQHLALVSTCTTMVRTLDDFKAYLADGSLDKVMRLHRGRS